MTGDTPATARLRRFAERSKALHAEYLNDPELLRQYEAFVAWLNDYMMTFYADLRPLPGYGAALDFDAPWNRLGDEPTMHPLIVRVFTRRGWTWGGKWKRPDGMHFQWGRNY